jgi:hypothetical protein
VDAAMKNAHELLRDVPRVVDQHLVDGTDDERTCIARIAEILESPDAVAVFNGLSIPDGQVSDGDLRDGQRPPTGK